MIKKIGLYLLKKFQFLIPESIFIRYTKGVLDKKDTSFTTSIVRNYFSNLYKNANPEKKKRLGLLMWRSEAAIQYFKNRNTPKPIIDKFLSITKQYNSFDICEIGTGNGYLINALSKHVSNERLFGIDLNDKQIKINQETYKNNHKVKFICEDIIKYIKNDAEKYTTVYISYVSLTTFTPEMIVELFKSISKRTTSSLIIIYEPIDSNTAAGNESILRSGLSYAHNYTTIAKQCGLTIIEELLDHPFLWLVCSK